MSEFDPLERAAEGAVDREHPWLGLDSFTEQSSAFFYGREDEVTELARRVQRKLLTVLFGQSGLGKTSILRAGIVPRLRPEGYCPVYVRISYAPESPPPSEQIKHAILRATEALGRWSRSGSADPGETLWEFLHHRDDMLTDLHGRALIPVLIFDQFEEIFTLAQTDEGGRRRAAEFIVDLADLVENRPPRTLEVRMETDDDAAAQFDFARSDYRILIALREDYLAHLESVKGAMPSITQNRMRLARMNGRQALAAVTLPGGKLVSEEVAEAIVRFVAGGAELINAEVEPSLLSLICRELNNNRIAQGRSEISPDLLAGSHASILSEFYARALLDQPAGVHQLIEEQLLTEGGFRENLAEERVLKAFGAAGAAPDALAILVNRRLLRIEERLDARRVELTHDVLCSVVRASRERRTEREALEASARLLEAQRRSESATRRSLVHARAVAAICALLMVFAVGSSLYAYRISQRAEQARNQSERLMVYLSDDFARELDGAGDLEVVAAFAKRTVAYYDGLPQNTAGSDTERNRAVAMVGYAETLALLDSARVAEADATLTEALAVLEAHLRNGDAGEATLVALGRGLTARCRVMAVKGDLGAGIKFCQRAAKLLFPLTSGPAPSVAARRAYGATMSYMGTLQVTSSDFVEANTSETAAKLAYASIGALDVSDVPATIGYAYGAAWQTTSQLRLGLSSEAERTGEEAYALVSKVLVLRPGHLRALRTRGYVSEGRANVANDAMRLGIAADRYTDSIEAWIESTQRDRMNALNWINLGDGHRQIAEVWFRLGKPQQAKRSLNAAMTALRSMTQNAASLQFQLSTLTRLASIQADLGDQAGSATSLADAEHVRKTRVRDEPAGSFVRAAMALRYSAQAGAVAELNGDAAQAKSIALQAIAAMAAIKPVGASQTARQNDWLYREHAQLGVVEYGQGDYRAAAQSLQTALALRKKNPPGDLMDRREQADAAIMLSMALSKLNRAAEARDALAPALALHRTLAKLNTDDQLQHVQLASALYAQALADPASLTGSLREARALIGALPTEMQALRSVAIWRNRIDLAAMRPASTTSPN